MRLTCTFLCLLFTIVSYAQIEIPQPSTVTDYATLDSINQVLKLKNGEKVTVHCTFKIDRKGTITNIKANGPHPYYEKKAIKILEKLPPFKDTKYKAGTTFSYPMSFVVESATEREKRLAKEAKKEDSEL